VMDNLALAQRTPGQVFAYQAVLGHETPFIC
jgi:hypothetical protein